MSIPEIVAIIRRSRLDLSDEKMTQSDLARVFLAAGVKFEREVRLSESDVVDFMINGVAIELKLRKVSKLAVYRQLARYAEHDKVQSLILLTSTSMGLPETINGKDAYLVKLGEAWL